MYTGEQSGPIFNMILAGAGKHCEVMIAQMKYDPKYGVVESLADITREHAASIEDFVVMAPGWEVVGTIDQKYKGE